jgi:hypothetical protein
MRKLVSPLECRFLRGEAVQGSALAQTKTGKPARSHDEGSFLQIGVRIAQWRTIDNQGSLCLAG